MTDREVELIAIHLQASVGTQLMHESRLEIMKALHAAQEAGKLTEEDAVVRLTRALRSADAQYPETGGSTRHYVRECLLDALREEGIWICKQAPTTQKEKDGAMKIEVTVCPREDLGLMSPNEEKEYEALVTWSRSYSFQAPEERINTTTRGWMAVSQWGAYRIAIEAKQLELLSRFQLEVYPWVPPGEPWPASIGENTYMTSWKIDLRAMNPLSGAEEL